MERLTTEKRRRIDAIHNQQPSVGNRMLIARGVLIGRDYSTERDRSHFLNVVDEGYRFYIDHGIRPAELSQWIGQVFQWISKQREVPDVSGKDCEVGPAPIKRW